jgi:uncharacterized membrane protein
MFNIRVECAHGLLIWGLGVLPLAYILNLTPILLESVIAIGLWITLLMFHEASYQLPIAPIAGLLILGVLLFSIGEASHNRWPDRRLNMPYFWVGVLLVLSVCYSLTFRFSYADPYYGTQHSGAGVFTSWFTVTGAIVATVLLIVTTTRVFRAARIEIYFAILLLLTTVFALLGVFSPWLIIHLYPVVVFNVLFALLALSLVLLGIERQHEALVNIGLLFFGLDMITRYFDWSWRFISGASIFLAGGIILLVIAGVLERVHRRIVSRMRAQTEGGETI